MKTIKRVFTAQVFVAFFVLCAAFTTLHSPDANALIAGGGGCTVTVDEADGHVTITCPAGGGGGGGECDISICGGGGPPPGGGGGGRDAGSKPDDKLVGELIVKLVTEYEPPCQASNEPSDVYAVRAQASCIKYVTGGITRAFPALTGALPQAIIAGAANACRLKITVDLPTTGGPPICK